MYRCIECKTLYKERIDYCDCGNNIFEEVPDISDNRGQASEYIVAEKKYPILPVNNVSIVIFSLCCLFSLCFIFFLGPAPKKREKIINKKPAVVKQIPNIESIWDDTPAYKVHTNASIDMDLYRAGLKNALLANFDMTAIEGAGSCDIQFVLDKHGNLKKKKLYQNTANKPLLNAVKKMLSSLKNYNPPPSCYDGAPMTLEVFGSGEDYQLRYKN